MTWQRAALTLTLGCVLWVLASDVYVDFPRVRERLAIAGLQQQRHLLLPLDTADRVPGRQLVLILRVRNTGDVPVNLSATAGDGSPHHLRIASHAAGRLDVVWPRSGDESERAEVSADADTWTLDSAELSNAHGFTRGAIDFLILPADQPFRRLSLLALGVCLAALAVAAVVRPIRWPVPIDRGQRALSAVAGLFFVIVALAPAVSAYRFVLARHSFVLAFGLLLNGPIVAVLARTARAAATRRDALSGAARRFGPPLIVAIGAVAYAAFLWQHMGAYAGGADSSGYLNSARLVAQGVVTTQARATPGVPDADLSPRGRQPEGFSMSAGSMVATYPIGLPLMLAAAGTIAGWGNAPGLVMWLHALMGVLVIYLLARCWLAGAAAWLPAVLVATSPLYVFMSLQTMSDVPAMVWTTAAVVTAWYGRSDARAAACSGAAFAMAVLVRPTNVLALVPIAMCLGGTWRSWLAFVAAGAPGAVLLGFYNLSAYGHVMATGYGDVSGAFEWRTLPLSMRTYARWLPALLTPLVVLAPIALVLRRAGGVRTVLLSWAVVFFAFYGAYSVTHETWWTLRFVLPAVPAVIVAAVWVGKELIDRAVRGAPAKAALAAVVWVLVLWSNGVWTARLGAAEIGRGEALYPDVCAWADTHVPHDAIVLAGQFSGALFYYTELPLVRWDLESSSTLRQVEADVTASGQTLYAVLHPVEVDDQHAFTRIPGRWALAGRVRGATIWRFEKP